jgi:hypothetical protein
VSPEGIEPSTYRLKSLEEPSHVVAGRDLSNESDTAGSTSQRLIRLQCHKVLHAASASVDGCSRARGADAEGALFRVAEDHALIRRRPRRDPVHRSPANATGKTNRVCSRPRRPRSERNLSVDEHQVVLRSESDIRRGIGDLPLRVCVVDLQLRAVAVEQDI